MHPVQHDLRSPVPPGSHVPGHLIICVSSQAKIQDLQNRKDIRQLLSCYNVSLFAVTALQFLDWVEDKWCNCESELRN